MKNESEILRYFFIDPCNNEDNFFDKYYKHCQDFELFYSLKRSAQTLQQHYFKLKENLKISDGDFQDIKKITEEIRLLCTIFQQASDEKPVENKEAFLLFQEIEKQVEKFNLKIKAISDALQSEENNEEESPIDISPIISTQWNQGPLLNRTSLCEKHLSSTESFYIHRDVFQFLFPRTFQEFLFSLCRKSIHGIYPQKSTSGWTPLMVAALMGHDGLVKTIFDKNLFNVETELVRNDGFNVLCCALLSGDTKTLLAVIDGLKQFELFEQAQKIEIKDIKYIKTDTTELANFIVHNESVNQNMKDTAQLYLDMINTEYHLTI